MQGHTALDTVTDASIEELARTLEQLRAAWLARRPGYEQRRDDLRRLRHAFHARLDQMVAALSADFGYRSTHESLLADGMIVLAELDHMLTRLRGWMRPQARSAGGRYGVVPIENSTEGVVNDTLDSFTDTRLMICGEIFLEISQDLLSKSGQRQDIEVISSHPQAYGQCRRWLATHLPDIPVLEVASTGQAAQKAGKNPNSAAIASAFAASLYNLRMVERRIEDHAGNTTHFFVIGPDAPGPTGHDKTSIIFSVEDVPGALYLTLRPLAERGLNMSRIVSRPTKTENWRYHFFVDLSGHREETRVGEALEEIEQMSAWFKLLGSFPQAPGVEKLS